MLPNGKEEAFLVKDPKCYAKSPFGPHYQVEIARGGVYLKHTGGNYNITVSGSNSRVNVGSTDQSTNPVLAGDTFNGLREALDEGVSDEGERERLKDLVNQVAAAADRKRFATAYQALIASAANHMTIIAPFLPALAGLLANFKA